MAPSKVAGGLQTPGLYTQYQGFLLLHCRVKKVGYSPDHPLSREFTGQRAGTPRLFTKVRPYSGISSNGGIGTTPPLS